MSDPLNTALVLLEHAARGEGNVELDKAQASALLVDRQALWEAAKQLKAEAVGAAAKAREACARLAEKRISLERPPWAQSAGRAEARAIADDIRAMGEP